MPTSKPSADGNLPLARLLSSAAPSWGIWKNVQSALSGSGDIDSVVLEDDEALVERAFVEWAVAQGIGPVFRCDHGGDLMRVLVAVDRGRRALIELDLTRRKTYRGATLFTADQMISLLEDDDLGFRRIRPGVEGVLLFFHNGVRYGGRPNYDGLAARKVVELLERDPPGVRLGTAMFEPASAAQRAVASLLVGKWSRSAVLHVEISFFARALFHPGGIARRIWFRAVTKKTCPIIRVAYAEGRRLPGDDERWLEAAEATHERLDVPRSCEPGSPGVTEIARD
jgi:hypothetical protein